MKQLTCDDLMKKLIMSPRDAKIVTNGQDPERFDIVTGIHAFKTSNGEVVLVIDHHTE